MKEYHKTTTDPKERQLRETPHEIVAALVKIYGCQIDLAANRSNKKLRLYLSDEPGDWSEGYRGDAFETDWSKLVYEIDPGADAELERRVTVGFCNPPYADIAPWLMKADEEARKGFTSVFLVPSFNGEKWNRLVWEAASQIILLEGRISFILPSTGKPDPGNNRGSMLAVFRPGLPHLPSVSYLTLQMLGILGELRGHELV